MKKLIPLFIFLLLTSSIFAKPTEVECLNRAAVVANIESFSRSGYLMCNFECYLDLKYSDYEVAPKIFFQIGSIDDPTKYKNSELNEAFLKTIEVTQNFTDEGYKLKLDLGAIQVMKNFISRLVIIENGVEKIINLNTISLSDDLTSL